MSREQRAKQFLPFAGVKGLDEALALKEEVLGQDPERLVAEDYLDSVSREIAALPPGSEVVFAMADGSAAERKARLIRVDVPNRTFVCEEGKIPFDAVRGIRTF